MKLPLITNLLSKVHPFHNLSHITQPYSITAYWPLEKVLFKIVVNIVVHIYLYFIQVHVQMPKFDKRL